MFEHTKAVCSNRGCTGDFSKKKISNTFFSRCKLVDMVCCMKSYQDSYQKKSYSRVLCAFSRDFSCFAGENAFFDGFLVVFTVVQPLLCLLDPSLFYRIFKALIMYIFLYSLLYQMK